jgi:hypothetical protein
MDINYFLLLRGKYNSMLSNINDMIETCIEINEYNAEFLTNNDRGLYMLFNSDANKKQFIESQKHVQHLKNICNQYIHSLCNHEFVKDDIDIDPDRSNTISYCNLCQLNEEQYLSCTR